MKMERFFLLVFLLSTAHLGAQANLIALGPNRSYKGTLNIGAREESRRFRISIPEDAFGITVDLEGSLGELDLALYTQGGLRVADTIGFKKNKTLGINRFSRPHPLGQGIYDIEVYLGSNLSGKKVDLASFSLSFQIINTNPPLPLPPGPSLKGRLEDDTYMYQVFELQVPGTGTEYRIDLFDTNGDLDLHLLPGPVPDTKTSFDSPRKSHGSETIFFDLRELSRSPGVKAGKIYAMVVAPYDTIPQEYRIVLTPGREVPGELEKLPTFNPGANGLARALLSTVEVLGPNGGGSGCLVHPGGYIVTNYHVIHSAQDGIPDSVEIGMNTDSTRPATPYFIASVIETDSTRDLALLKIESTMYGSDLPPGYRFPYLETAKGSLLAPGEDIYIVGYPANGGLGSRASITVSKGIVAGFQILPIGNVIKTDASVSPGSSGGAALDKSFRLFGLPTEILLSRGGTLSYIYPLELIPESWVKSLPPIK